MNRNTFNLFLILLFTILLGGLLFYLNTISNTLQKCCESGTTPVIETCSISYPTSSIGADIPNLLSNADGATVALSYDPSLISSGVYPLRADLTTMDCTVRVVIKTSDPDFQIGFFPNQHNWFGRFVAEQEWEFFSYGPGVADGNFNLQGSGTGIIEVYENGSGVPAKTLNLELN